MQNLVNSWKAMKELKMPQDPPASPPAESFVESPCEKTGKEKAFPAMKSSPLWETLMALADSRVEWIATLLTKKWSIPGTWQWMGRPAMIRTRLFSEICSTMLLSKTYNELSMGLTARSVGHSNRTCKKNRTHTIRLQYLSRGSFTLKEKLAYWLASSQEFQQRWCCLQSCGRMVDPVFWETYLSFVPFAA